MGREEIIEDEKVSDRPARKRLKGKSPVKIISILIILAVLCAGGFYAWNSGLLKGFGKDKKKAHAAAGIPQKVEMGPIRSMETFIVNLADPLGKRYLKVRMDLELSDEKMVPEVEKRLPQLRDAILTALSSKTYEEIGSLDGKMQLRAEIIAMLNQYLKTGKVTNVYFGEFVVQ